MFTLSLGLLITTCTDDNTDFDPLTGPVLKSFGYSPRGFPVTYDRSEEFFQDVEENFSNGAVLFSASWRDNLASSGQIPNTQSAAIQLGERFGFVPIIVFGWYDGEKASLDHPDDATNSWANSKLVEAFVQMARSFALTYKPLWMFLGNETDTYFERVPEDYPNWIRAYQSAYRAIKEVSPSTLVGTVINYEHTFGRGKLNGWTEDFSGALTQHDLSTIDILGINVYAFFEAAKPENVPLNHLDPVLSLIGDKPFIVNESGWPADSGEIPTVWEVSEEHQVTWANRIREILIGKNVRSVSWVYMNEFTSTCGTCTKPYSLCCIEANLFGDISLRRSDGSKRPVYDIWKNISF